MSWVGGLGILLGLLSYPWSTLRSDRTHFAFFMLLYLVHIGATLFSYELAQTSASDSRTYYYDTWGFYGTGIGLSTTFLIYLVQIGRDVIGGTFLDYFLIFQLFGFFGIVALMRIFQEIYAELDLQNTVYSYFVLFLPGIHFWTSNIGKDGPLFFAACLAIWASMRLTQRYLAFTAAVAVMVLFRPHIALLALAAVAITILLDRRTGAKTKLLLLFVAVAGMGLAISLVNSAFAIDLTNADSVSELLTAREEVTERIEEGMTTAVLGAPFPVKLISLLFRPLFFDASEAMAYAASMENAVFLLIFMATFFNVSRFMTVVLKVGFARFCFFFFLLTAFLLTLFYYNVGLGLRQKTMFVPAILVLFVTRRALYQARQARQPVEAVA